MSLFQPFTNEHTATLTKLNIKFKVATAGNPDDIDFSSLNLNNEPKIETPRTLRFYQHSQYQSSKQSQREEMLKSARFVNKSISSSDEYSDERTGRLRQSDEHINRDRSRSPLSRMKKS